MWKNTNGSLKKTASRAIFRSSSKSSKRNLILNEKCRICVDLICFQSLSNLSELVNKHMSGNKTKLELRRRELEVRRPRFEPDSIVLGATISEALTSSLPWD